MNLPAHALRVLRKDGVLPNNLIYFVTNRCNMKCEHCFYWEDLNAKTRDLTVEELDRITRTMGPMLHIVLTGGEPYLRKDIDQIIRVFHENTGCEIFTIPSNGFYGDVMVEKLTQVLTTLPKVSVVQDISFDDLGERHDAIRRVPGAFARATETFARLKTLQRSFPKLNVGIITTFTSSNQDHFTDIIKGLFDTLAPDSIFINLVRGNPKEKVNVGLDIRKYEEAVAFRNRLYAERKMNGYRSFPLHQVPHAAREIVNETVAQTFRTGQYQTPCYAGRLQAVIQPNGDVFPCEILTDKMGNLREFSYDFGQLWRASTSEKIRRWISDTKCFCTHECFVTTNVLFNPLYYPRIAKRVLEKATAP